MPSVCEHIGKWEPLYATGTLTLGKAIWQYLLKLKMYTPYNLSIPLLDVYSTGPSNTAVQPMDYLSFCH